MIFRKIDKLSSNFVNARGAHRLHDARKKKNIFRSLVPFIACFVPLICQDPVFFQKLTISLKIFLQLADLLGQMAQLLRHLLVLP